MLIDRSMHSADISTMCGANNSMQTPAAAEQGVATDALYIVFKSSSASSPREFRNIMATCQALRQKLAQHVSSCCSPDAELNQPEPMVEKHLAHSTRAQLSHAQFSSVKAAQLRHITDLTLTSDLRLSQQAFGRAQVLVDLRCLLVLQSLQRLSIQHCLLRDGIETLMHLRNLHTLDLSNALEVNNKLMGLLPRMPALTSLSLPAASCAAPRLNQCTAQGLLMCLPHLRKLKEFHLCSTDLEVLGNETAQTCQPSALIHPKVLSVFISNQLSSIVSLTFECLSEPNSSWRQSSGGLCKLSHSNTGQSLSEPLSRLPSTSNCAFEEPATKGTMYAALMQLTKLTQLKHLCLGVHVALQYELTSPAWSPFCLEEDTNAYIPAPSSQSVEPLPTIHMPLRAVPSLTFDDNLAVSLCQALTQLTSLGFKECWHLGTATLDAIATNLSGLQSLDLEGSCRNMEAQELTRLSPLSHLSHLGLARWGEAAWCLPHTYKGRLQAVEQQGYAVSQPNLMQQQSLKTHFRKLFSAPLYKGRELKPSDFMSSGVKALETETSAVDGNSDVDAIQVSALSYQDVDLDDFISPHHSFVQDLSRTSDYGEPMHASLLSETPPSVAAHALKRQSSQHDRNSTNDPRRLHVTHSLSPRSAGRPISMVELLSDKPVVAGNMVSLIDSCEAGFVTTTSSKGSLFPQQQQDHASMARVTFSPNKPVMLDMLRESQKRGRAASHDAVHPFLHTHSYKGDAAEAVIPIYLGGGSKQKASRSAEPADEQEIPYLLVSHASDISLSENIPQGGSSQSSQPSETAACDDILGVLGAQHPTLAFLDLSSWKLVKFNQLRLLASSPAGRSIKTLKLVGCHGVDAAEIRALSGMENLQHLDLSYTCPSAELLAALPSISRLSDITLISSSMTWNASKALQQQAAAHSIRIRGFVDADKSFVSMHNAIKRASTARI